MINFMKVRRKHWIWFLHTGNTCAMSEAADLVYFNCS